MNLLYSVKGLLLLLFNLFFNKVNLLQYDLCILFELVNFLTHDIYKACTLLVRYAQETDVVLVCCNLVLETESDRKSVV